MTPSCPMEILKLAGQQLYKWTRGASTFLGWPERGARLINWRLNMASGVTREIIYWPESADYSEPTKIHGGNPILFPFVAHTFAKGKRYHWIDPEGTCRPMPLHGFAMGSAFRLESCTESGFTAVLEPEESTQELYPFDYTFLVHYRFEELCFFVDLELINREKTRSIPWCAGHHFYFTLPWHSGLQRSDYQISIPAKKAFYLAKDGALMPTPYRGEPSTFDSSAIVDRFHCKLKDNQVLFGPKSGEENISIQIGPDRVPSPWTTVTTWTETPQTPYYCVEPWMGPANSPTFKEGLHWVEPGGTETFSVKVALL